MNLKAKGKIIFEIILLVISISIITGLIYNTFYKLIPMECTGFLKERFCPSILLELEKYIDIFCFLIIGIVNFIYFKINKILKKDFYTKLLKFNYKLAIISFIFSVYDSLITNILSNNCWRSIGGLGMDSNICSSKYAFLEDTYIYLFVILLFLFIGIYKGGIEKVK